MGKSLVIVESPAKVKKIQSFLGSEYIVKASYGHCFQIDPKNTSIDIDNNFEPKYVPALKKDKVIQELKAAVKSCSTVFIASDPDREGEAIGWHIAKFIVKNSTPIKRVTFHEITKSAVLGAFNNATTLDEPMYHSQQARAVLDRLVGYSVSPILWRKVMRGTSAGRVQSIGLEFIVDRQKEIDAFIPEEYWDITGIFKTEKEKSFIAMYSTKEKITNGDQTKNIVDNINKEKGWKIASIERSEKIRKSTPLFTTSTMQQFCSTHFNWPGKKTMSVAQNLYEAGLCTYHRTDSTNISKEAIDEVRAFIPAAYGSKYLPSTPKFYKTKNKSAQEAHEGIRPSHIEEPLSNLKSQLDLDQYKLYEAIYYKFLSCQMTDAIFDSEKVTVLSNSGAHTFIANGQKMLFDGFLKAWPYASAKDEELPDMQEKESAVLVEIKPEQHFTKPPAAFNDASLVKILEESGVGRPSTYASIIDTLTIRNYVTREGKAFKPTDLGKLVCDYLVKSFPELMNAGYTARIEDKLDEIAEGKLVWYNTVSDFYTELKKRLDVASSGASTKQNIETDIVCPTCGKNKLTRKRSRFGEFYGCSGYILKGKEQCKAMFKIGEEGQPVAKKEVRYLDGIKCDKCGSKIAIRINSKTNIEFFACSGFPKCKRVFNIDGTPIEFKRRTYGKKKED
jgi:DNA topoisomerase-1